MTEAAEKPIATPSEIKTRTEFYEAVLAGCEKIFPIHYGKDKANPIWESMTAVFRDMNPGSTTLWFSQTNDASYPSIRGAAYRAIPGRGNPFRAYRVDATTIAVQRAGVNGFFGPKISAL